MRPSPHPSFCKKHRGTLTMICMDSFLHAKASLPKTAGHRESYREVWGSLWYISSASLAPTAPHLQIRSFAIRSGFVCTSTNVRTRPKKWLFALGWVQTQGLLCITPGVALNKTPSISRRKFRMKSPISFDFFEKNSSPGSDRTTRKEAQQLRRISQKNNQKSPSFLREMDQHFPEVIISLTLLWPSPRLHLLGILETRLPHPPKSLGTSPYTPRIHIIRDSRMARPPIKKIGRRKRGKHHRRDAEKGGKSSISVAGVDAFSTAGKTCPRRKDFSQINCFNHEKKGHYATSCPASKRNVSED